ncbi:MAG: amidotransferase [Verrucomicrobiota bacterium JB022]|nr:amidotransferase [Verrucomicrobiota bacterium JB022]
MEVHVLQHLPFEAPGSIASWAEARGHQLKVTHLYAGQTVPAADEIRMLIVLGGSMGVNDEADYPWMTDEKKLLRHLLHQTQVPVAGICLGAQLIASCLGQRVFRGPVMEVGWAPLMLTPAAREDRVAWQAGITPLHWHHDTFELPPEAIVLASTPDFSHQAYRWQDRVLGLQFHLEATPAGVEALCAECPQDVQAGVWGQTQAQITNCAIQCVQTQPLLFALLDDLASQAQ